MSRDPNRIHSFLYEIEKYWNKVPDWRFGQLMVNVYGSQPRDPFFFQEDESLKIFEQFFKEVGEQQ